MNTERIATVKTGLGKGTDVRLLTETLELRDGWQQISVHLWAETSSDNSRRVYLESASNVGIVIRPETHIIKTCEMIAGVTVNWQLSLNAVPVGAYQCALIVDDGKNRQRLILPLLVQTTAKLSGFTPHQLAQRPNIRRLSN